MIDDHEWMADLNRLKNIYLTRLNEFKQILEKNYEKLEKLEKFV